MENRSVPILILHVIALKHNPTLHLAKRVGLRELRMLFETELEQAAKVHSGLVLHGLLLYIAVLADKGFVPDALAALFAKAGPFAFHRNDGSWVSKHLLLTNGASNTRVGREKVARKLWPMCVCRVIPENPHDWRASRVPWFFANSWHS